MWEDLFYIQPIEMFTYYWTSADKRKKYAWSATKRMYSPGHNYLRLFNVLANFPFTARETKRDY